MRKEPLFVAAAVLLVLSVALILVGAVLRYRYGPGLGATLFQIGRVMLIVGGAATIWYFKWRRGPKRGEPGSRTKRSPAAKLGMYAFWIVVVGVLSAIVLLQREGSYFVANAPLRNSILAVLPLLLTALVVAYFLVRYSERTQPEQENPAARTKRTKPRRGR